MYSVFQLSQPMKPPSENAARSSKSVSSVNAQSRNAPSSMARRPGGQDHRPGGAALKRALREAQHRLPAEQRYDELRQYFAKLSENLPTQLNMIDCGNRLMNTVLNMELAKLKSERISFEHQLVVPPVLPFPDEEICSIITNLLDNAAEECRRLLQKGWGAVRVRLEIYPHQSYLFIKCSNSTDRELLSRSRGGIRTTKEDERLHGYGTKIISKLADKHNGCADFSLSGGQFVAQVMLDMTEERHDA